MATLQVLGSGLTGKAAENTTALEKCKRDFRAVRNAKHSQGHANVRASQAFPQQIDGALCP